MKLRFESDKNKLNLSVKLSKSKPSVYDIFLCIPKESGTSSASWSSNFFYQNINSRYSYYIAKVKAPLLSRLLRSSESKYDLPLFVKRYKLYLNDLVKKKNTNLESVELMLSEISLLLNTLRELEVKGDHRKLFRDSDEICTYHTEQYLLSFIDNHKLSKKSLAAVMLFVDEQSYYRTRLYGNSDAETTTTRINRKENALCKFIELEQKTLILGKLREQLVFSLSAFLSMSITTAIVFSVQNDYGNLSFNLFLALCISYIFKDRFKEIFRVKILNKINRNRDQKKTSLTDKNGNIIGTVYELIQYSKLDLRGRTIRKKGVSTNRKNDEYIVHYRKKVSINDNLIDSATHIIDYSTIYLDSIISKLPNQEIRYRFKNDDAIELGYADELHEINIIIFINSKDPIRYKITTSSNEIKDCTEIKYSQF